MFYPLYFLIKRRNALDGLERRLGSSSMTRRGGRGREVRVGYGGKLIDVLTYRSIHGRGGRVVVILSLSEDDAENHN
jgi:hypothetical protein